MRGWRVVSVVVLLAASNTQRAPVPPYGAYYAIRLRIDPLRGSTVGTARLVVPTTPAEAPLRLFAGPSLAVDSVMIARHPGRFERHGDTLLIRPPLRAVSGRADVEVFFRGTASAPAFSMEPHAGAPATATYGLPYSSRAWWPSPGSTLAKADSADMVLTVPKPLVAVSNGRLLSTAMDSDGWVTYHWATHHPIYPDVMSIAVAPYVELRDSAVVGTRLVPMRFYVFAEDTMKARTDFARLPRIVEFFSQRLGPYPFADEKYGVAEFTTQSFREHQTVPSLGPRFLTGDRRNEWILAHELAHQWFGNSLSVRTWNDVWLNEGLATYAAILWMEHVGGGAAYDSAIAQARTRPFEGSIAIADSMDVDHMFNATTFFKAALMVDALRRGLGDDRFFAALEAYVRGNAYSLVSTTDFERAMEQRCGRSLSGFFSLWLTGTEPVSSMSAAGFSATCS